MTDTNPLRVLVIDDEPAIRSLLADLLQHTMGADVDVADSGAKGLALFARRRYDLVLTDLLMPGMLGWEVADAVRRRDPSAKVVMLTGSAQSRDIEHARRAGFTVLAKPIHLDELTRAIEQVLRGEAVEMLP